MAFIQPNMLFDGQFAPPAPAPSMVDGGYNWGQRRFGPPSPPPGPGQAGHQYNPNGPNPAQPLPGGGGNPVGSTRLLPPIPHQPVLMPQSPVPSKANLSQMRQAMTQLHMQQMLARLTKHVAIHSGA